MKNLREILFSLNRLGVLLLLVPMLATAQQNNQGAKTVDRPMVKITLVPFKGEGSTSWGEIGGSVEGIKVEGCDCSIVIYVHTDVWYVQPTRAEPFTKINPDGTWKTGTHLGYDYAALLVKSSFKADPTRDNLPDVGVEVLAVAVVPGREK